MSHSSAMKHENIDMKGLDTQQSANGSSNDLLLTKSLSNSSSSNESSSPQRRVVKSCFWSTAIFSMNFISSILVINLSKWYVDNMKSS